MKFCLTDRHGWRAGGRGGGGIYLIRLKIRSLLPVQAVCSVMFVTSNGVENDVAINITTSRLESNY